MSDPSDTDARRWTAGTITSVPAVAPRPKFGKVGRKSRPATRSVAPKSCYGRFVLKEDALRGHWYFAAQALMVASFDESAIEGATLASWRDASKSGSGSSAHYSRRCELDLQGSSPMRLGTPKRPRGLRRLAPDRAHMRAPINDHGRPPRLAALGPPIYAADAKPGAEAASPQLSKRGVSS
jgi:hypothetical protein